MKKGLLGSTAIIAATALTVGAAQAQEAPTASFSGFMNFQVYLPDTEYTSGGVVVPTFPSTAQEEAMAYFGVDDAELTLQVIGTTAAGLEYGFKVEFEGSPGGGNVADEARIELEGSWGTLQLGDEDGAEDTLNVGGESIMGATGGFDGDQDDHWLPLGTLVGLTAPTYPNIAGDTSDASKITYYSPNLSGIKLGVSYTPVPGSNGDAFKTDGAFNNHYGLGAKFDGAIGGVNLQASAVYSAAEALSPATEDISAFSVGAIVGFGPVEVGANWTDNGESGFPVGSGAETSYWNAAVGFTSGPLYLSAGYFASVLEITGVPDIELTNIALTADYTIAEGLKAYGEISMIEEDIAGVFGSEATLIIVGTQVSF